MYREPFGAVQVGSTVSLAIDVWDEPEARCSLRLWTDEKGEELIDMVGERMDGFLRFSVSFRPEGAEIIWYSFRITAADGSVWRYGAACEHGCGEGAFVFGEPPSFQITVYDPEREAVPEWYKRGVVYQIFPDRFARGKGWRERVEADMARPYTGPTRRLVEDWDTYPRYEKDASGRISAWDFYGGTLEGIREKLPYLEGLGITIIYFNPIFSAASNHRYDTADYLHIDGSLGTEEDFSRLCADAASHGISIILDGVFNHVGADSIYFNRAGIYPDLGAYQGENSLYRSWFTFNGDGSYESWWGIDDLPAVREDCPEFRELICGHDGVVRKWLRLGARGWRLDVADELSDEFLRDIKSAALAEREDAVVIGEVWEDATNKYAYGTLRRYFQGGELDGTMNYPLRRAILRFLTGEATAGEFVNKMESLYENYPRENFMSELNLLGSHDRIRLLTILGDAPRARDLDDEQRYRYRLSDGQRSLAVSRLWIAALLQMCMPGVPSVYYGDEAGLEGFSDPYCRAPFPWGDINQDCFTIYRNAIALRRSLPALTDGDFEPFAPNDDVLGLWRRNGIGKICVLVNASLTQSHTVRVKVGDLCADDVVSGRPCKAKDGEVEVFLWPLGSTVLDLHEEQRLQVPMERGMGVLCHISSLPNIYTPERLGSLGEPALRFVDRLVKAGIRYWQVLPVNPTDAFGSPYAGLSAFAGNISLMWGVDAEGPTALHADFEGSPELRRFIEDNEDWLLPYATFRAIKGEVGDEKPWQEWSQKYQTWSSELVGRKELVAGIRRELALQYSFMQQWSDLHRYANERGIKIIGDMPMYVSADSADVWAERDIFALDTKGYPIEVAGTPPSGSGDAGQIWGNPTYRWHHLRETGYEWWMRRLERSFELYDYVRLDHFLGFSSYYAIPTGRQAADGRWNFGPGLDLFQKAYDRFGPLPFVAEDLGSITPAVRSLLSKTGFPGMDVIQFANEDVRSGYHPAPGKLVYTSTHDTHTLLGWVEEQFGFDKNDPEQLREALVLAESLTYECLLSDANVVVIPLQDLLLCDDQARMNVPGETAGNWSWQAESDALENASRVMDAFIKGSGR